MEHVASARMDVQNFSVADLDGELLHLAVPLAFGVGTDVTFGKIYPSRSVDAVADDLGLFVHGLFELGIAVAFEDRHDNRASKKVGPCTGVSAGPKEAEPGQGLESLVVLVIVNHDWRLQRFYSRVPCDTLDNSVLDILRRQGVVVWSRHAALDVRVLVLVHGRVPETSHEVGVCAVGQVHDFILYGVFSHNRPKVIPLKA